MIGSAIQWLRLNGISVQRVSPLREMVRRLTEAGEELNFIQVGANDGISYDDFSKIVREYSISGVCIEPIPSYHEKLAVLYQDTPRVRTLNAAIHPTQKTMELYSYRPGAANFAFVTGLTSFNPSHLRRHGARDEDMQVDVVPCVTLSDVYRQFFQGKRVDIIQIDVEGFDAEVVKSIDFDLMRPRFIRYEHEHLDKETQRATLKLLARNGYKIKRESVDTLAYRPDDFRLSRLLNI